MGLGEWTIQQLRELAAEEDIDLGDATLKADIVAKIEAAQAESQAEVEAEEYAVNEPEGYEYEQPQDEQPPPGTAEPVVQAGGYVATEQGWVLKESLEG